MVSNKHNSCMYLCARGWSWGSHYLSARTPVFKSYLLTIKISINSASRCLFNLPLKRKRAPHTGDPGVNTLA